MGYRPTAGALFYHFGALKTTVRSQERVPLGVETGERLRAGEISEVVPALAVLRFVVNDAPLHFHLADGKVPLEVGGVVLGVPQAKLHR